PTTPRPLPSACLTSYPAGRAVVVTITAGICDIGLMMTRDRVGRRPEDEHAQALLDVVEAVLDAGPDEHQTAGPHRSILIRNSNDAAPADHVVHLVLAMRLLMICGPGRPHRETDA